ncbi:MAG: histidine kinase, partial [Pseudomonadota bacterium]
QESKAFLTEAQRVARIGSWMLDLTTNEMRWSAETYRVLGANAGTPLNHEVFLQHVHPDDRDAVEKARRMTHKGESYEIEYRVLAGAAIRWVRERADLELAANGMQRRCVGTVQDITERKQADKALRESEDRLRQAYHERERLAQDLHDGIVQSIYAIGMGLEQVQRQIAYDTGEARKNLSEAIRRLNAVIREVRNHIIGLQREELTSMRLLTELHDILRSAKAAQGVQFSLNANPIVLTRLSPGMAYEVLNIVREAVSNSLRHSGGRQGVVSLSERDGRVIVSIEDDGAGFDILIQREQGHGLRNMAARAQTLAARFDIRTRPGHGTRVVVDIPLESEHV